MEATLALATDLHEPKGHGPAGGAIALNLLLGRCFLFFRVRRSWCWRLERGIFRRYRYGCRIHFVVCDLLGRPSGSRRAGRKQSLVLRFQTLQFIKSGQLKLLDFRLFLDPAIKRCLQLSVFLDQGASGVGVCLQFELRFTEGFPKLREHRGADRDGEASGAALVEVS